MEPLLACPVRGAELVLAGIAMGLEPLDGDSSGWNGYSNMFDVEKGVPIAEYGLGGVTRASATANSPTKWPSGEWAGTIPPQDTTRQGRDVVRSAGVMRVASSSLSLDESVEKRDRAGACMLVTFILM